MKVMNTLIPYQADTFLTTGRVAAPQTELCSLESTNEEILRFP
jgi:hypothetical protein